MIELRLLGPLTLSGDNPRAERLMARTKRMGLLAYLAAARPRGYHKRATLYALFWPESSEGRARAALNQSVYVLRSALGDDVIETRGDGDIRLRDSIWCDVIAFERLLDAERPEEALHLFAGAFLEGFFVRGSADLDHWIDRERAHLQQRAADAAWIVAEQRAAEGRTVDAERFARRGLALLQSDEMAMRRFMQFLNQLGDRSAALRAYAEFEQQLQNEYGLAPSPTTRALADSIRAAPSASLRIDAGEDTSSPNSFRSVDGPRPFRRVVGVALAGMVLLVGAVAAERISRAGRPTRVADAYAYYQRGLDHYRHSFNERDTRLANTLFARAVSLDTAFTLAWARLADSHAQLYWFHYDRTSNRLDMARQAMHRAVQLDSTLPEVQVSRGNYHYWGHQAYDSALTAYRQALRMRPDDSEVLESIGNVRRRQGDLPGAIASFSAALELEPHSARVLSLLAATLALAGDHARAERHFDRVMTLYPDFALPYYNHARFHMATDDNLAEARRILSLDLAPRGDPSIRHLETLMDLFEGRYREAIDRLTATGTSLDNQWQFVPVDFLIAEAYEQLGMQDSARLHHGRALALATSQVRLRPGEAHYHGAAAIAYAGLGRKTDALAAARRAIELMPMHRDAWRGLYRIEDLARVHAMLGEEEAAIATLERLEGLAGGATVAFLNADPAWQRLRKHQRFQTLLANRRIKTRRVAASWLEPTRSLREGLRESAPSEGGRGSRGAGFRKW